jgi:hypothetical protein
MLGLWLGVKVWLSRGPQGGAVIDWISFASCPSLACGVRLGTASACDTRRCAVDRQESSDSSVIAW